jgi:hypothetical protein
LPVAAADGTREGESVREREVLRGVWLRGVPPVVGVPPKDMLFEEGFGRPGTYSFPSTLAERRSLYSSPTSPE